MDRHSAGNMISLKFTLLFLLFRQIFSENPEQTFRPVGTGVELGYCFGVDYIVVYRVTREGDQLLGNSSTVSPAITPPSDLQGRIGTTQDILSLQMKNLTHHDTGTYRRECWKNHTLVSQHTQQLTVCDSEAKSVEIIVSEDEDAEIQCSPAIGLEGVTLLWFYEKQPLYTITQLLDSRVSLDPVEGVLEVKYSGALLVLDRRMLSNTEQFYCLVFKDAQCVSFQNLYMPDNQESDIFVSHGDRVILYCEADGNNQYWDTPTGKVENNTDERSHHMFISTGDQSEHFSLIIHAASREHFGEYFCFSSSAEMQYRLVLCPKKESSENFVFEGGEVTLYCDIGQQDSYMVLWYRREASGQQELIYDSGDVSVPIPEDLRGRMAVSDDDSALTISSVVRQDEGEYWCVVLKGVEYIEDEERFLVEYEDEYEDEEEEEGSGPDWIEENKCIFKQEAFLSVNKKRPVGFIENTPQEDPATSPPPPSPPPQSPRGRMLSPPAPTSPRGAAYTTGACVGVMLAVMVIDAVFFV